MNDIEIRQLGDDEIKGALELALRVFLEYEAPDYGQDGVDEFNRSLHDDSFLRPLTFFGAFNDGELVGVAAARNGFSHIALLFVDGAYQRQGIGKALLETVKENCAERFMTVNAAPFGVSIYRKWGFIETDVQQNVNGILFTPMRSELGGK